jgi:C_GCAxxG_C_C family probable redox protein
MNRREQAVTYKHSGSNCCQAVLKAFEDELELSEDTLMKLGAPFCVGMGCFEATCGALIAAEMILGLKKYEGRPIIPAARTLHENFRQKCGATLCKELKGLETGKVICPCDECVGNAVDILEEYLNK